MGTAQDDSAVRMRATTRRMRLGQKLAQDGLYDAALREFLWCFDEGAVHQPSFNITRLSFLLGEIMALSSASPDVRDALIVRRDRAELAVRSGRMTDGNLDDVTALNWALGEGERSVVMFKWLGNVGEPGRTAQKHVLWHLKTQVCDDRQYDVLAGFALDLVEQMSVFLDAQPRVREKRGPLWSYVSSELLSTFEIVVGLGDLSAAASVAEMAVSTFNATSELFIMLYKCALRARSVTAQEYIERLAASSLDAEEAGRFREAVRELS